MRAVTKSWNFALLCTIALSLRINPKAASLDSLKGMASDETRTTQERKTDPVKWHQNRERFQENNRFGKHTKDEEDLKLEMMFCQPYPSIVQVPEPEDWRSFYMPSFVKLHRCKGGCSISPRIGYCAVTKEEKVSIAVLFGQNTKQVVMRNHTACKCSCLPEKCHSWQRFDDDICDCVCIDDRQLDCKEKKNKRWDRNLCQCVCSAQPLNCDFGFKWSEESCMCELDENMVGGIDALKGKVRINN